MGASQAVKNVNNFFDFFFLAAKSEDLLHSSKIGAVWEECMPAGVVQTGIGAFVLGYFVDTMDATRINLK
jgi:hypothetical protein